MFRRLCVLILAAAPVVAFAAASKEMQELQRDVALLQEQVRQLQQSQDKQLAALTVLVQQAVDAANRANTAVEVIKDSSQTNNSQLESKVVAPVVGLSTRMDSVSNNFTTLQQSVADLTSLVVKLQSQMTDLNNAVKVMQTPAPAPPPNPGAPSAAAGEAPCPSSSKDLYDNARRDLQGGKPDIALQEFGDYLRCFGSTDLAPNAQYYIGTIHLAQDDYPAAYKDFDTVLEKYSDNNKTPDALFYKGETLVKMGRRTDAQKEYRDLLLRFPKDNMAPRACSRLTDLGYRCPAPAPAAHPAPKKHTTATSAH
ncbi:MAG: tetratricopeptide repeat protein [Bryobacteraceae bacterium]|jgi:TolA-binding protein